MKIFPHAPPPPEGRGREGQSYFLSRKGDEIPMQLTKDEEKMLSGGYGEGYRRAIEILVKLGEFYDAKRLVPISMAYLIVGPSPSKPGKASEWLNEMADLGATFRCPLALVLSIRQASAYDSIRSLARIRLRRTGHPRNSFVFLFSDNTL
jgi:hypothetical protein